MTNEKNLTTIFNGLLAGIHSALSDKLTQRFKEVLDEKKRKTGVRKLMEQKGVLEVKLNELKTQISELDRKIEDEDRRVRDEAISPEISNLLSRVGVYQYDKTVCKVAAAEQLLNSPEYTNLQNFIAIKKNAENMYGLAVSAKERRSIILTVQSKNWRSLGIQVPELPLLEEFKIQKGEIILPEAQLLTTPQKNNKNSVKRS